MFVSRSLLLAVSASLPVVLGQNTTSNSSVSSCPQNATFVDKAAGWGTAGALWPIDGTGSHRDNASAYYTWMYSVQPDGTTNTTLNVPPGSPAPNVDDSWRICTLPLFLSLNLIKRAQSDNGSCRSMLDDACVDSILNAARINALGETASIACVNAAEAVRSALGSGSCRKFVHYSVYTVDAILVPNNTQSNDSCEHTSRVVAPGYTLVGTSIDGKTNAPTGSAFGNATGINYYYASFRNVIPLVTVYVRNNSSQIANGADSTDSGQFVGMACPRVTKWDPTYGEAPALGFPTPISSSTRLITSRGSVLADAILGALLTILVLFC